MSMAQSVKVQRSMAKGFEYPKAQQVLYWLMKAAGYGRKRWKGHTSQGTLERISKGEWVKHDTIKEFVGEAIDTLASLALGQDEHMQNETGTNVVAHVMEGFVRWDRITQSLNRDREIELTAPLGAVPILRMAAIQVGCTVGAIHAALEPDGDATIKNPFGGGAFADYARTQFEKTWPGESVESWASHAEAADDVLDRKTVHGWLKGQLPRQAKRLGPLTMLMVKMRTEREGDRTDEKAIKAKAEAMERRMRFCLMLDRIGEKLRAWFGVEHRDYYKDLELELVRSAQRTYAILTHDEYPIAELAQMSALSAEEPPTGQGILMWLRTVKNANVTEATLNVEQARTLIEQLHTQALAGEMNRRMVRKLLAIWSIFGAPLPHLRMRLIEPPMQGGWFLDYMALLGDVHAHLRDMHHVITIIMRTPMPDGLDRETVLRGSLMFNAKRVDGRSLGLDLNFHIAAASAPPGTDIHAIVSRVNEQLRIAERLLDRRLLSITADAVPDELLRFDDLDLDAQAPEILLELAKLCLKRKRLQDAINLLAAAIPRAPKEPALWQLLIDVFVVPLREILCLMRKMPLVGKQPSPDAESIGPEMEAAMTELMDELAGAHANVLEALNLALHTLKALDPNAARQCEIDIECEHIFFCFDLHASGFSFPGEEIGTLHDRARWALAAIGELAAKSGPDGPMHERMARLHLVLGDRHRAREHAKEADLLGFPEALVLLSKSS